MGKFFEWDASQYLLNVHRMDEQHQILIGMMNELAERNEQRAPRAELLELLKKLGRYTVKHFTEEEAYMEAIGYPKREGHLRIHRELVRNLHEHVDAFVKGDGRVSPLLLSFLKMWLGAHIKGIDRQYANFSQTKSA